MFDPQAVDNKFTVIKRRDFVSQTGRGLSLIGAVGGVCKRLWQEDRRINYTLFLKKCLYRRADSLAPKNEKKRICTEYRRNISN